MRIPECWRQVKGRGKSNPRTVIRGRGERLVCVIESGASEEDRALITSAAELRTELENVLSWAVTEKSALRQQEMDSIERVLAKSRGEA